MDKETGVLVKKETSGARRQIRQLEKDGLDPEVVAEYRSLIEELAKEGDLERLKQARETLRLVGKKHIELRRGF